MIKEFLYYLEIQESTFTNSQENTNNNHRISSLQLFSLCILISFEYFLFISIYPYFLLNKSSLSFSPYFILSLIRAFSSAWSSIIILYRYVSSDVKSFDPIGFLFAPPYVLHRHFASLFPQFTQKSYPQLHFKFVPYTRTYSSITFLILLRVDARPSFDILDIV